MDTDELADYLSQDDGEAAREHLRAGRAVYLERIEEPGVLVKLHPDGTEERIDPNDLEPLAREIEQARADAAVLERNEGGETD